MGSEWLKPGQNAAEYSAAVHVRNESGLDWNSSVAPEENKVFAEAFEAAIEQSGIAQTAKSQLEKIMRVRGFTPEQFDDQLCRLIAYLNHIQRPDLVGLLMLCDNTKNLNEALNSHWMTEEIERSAGIGNWEQWWDAAGTL